MSAGDPELSVRAAQAAAARDELASWVHGFLCSPGSDNAVLADALMDPPRAWLGPVLVPLDQLQRLAGPPGDPVLVEVEEDDWRDDVEDLAEKLRDGLEAPPLIATCDDTGLVLEDGNHRAEALRRAGQEEAWTVVAFADEAERDAFIERTG